MRLNLPDRPHPIRWLKGRVAQSLIWRYRLFLLAGVAAILGGTLFIAGLVSIAFMPFLSINAAIVTILAASLAISIGVVLILAVYIWLTL